MEFTRTLGMLILFLQFKIRNGGDLALSLDGTDDVGVRAYHFDRGRQHFSDCSRVD